MSDYISKRATMQRFLKEIEQSRSDCIHINTIKRLLDDIDTLDEKEIIRKAFERVVERFEEEKGRFNGESAEFWTYRGAIEIVKEEGAEC